MNVAGNGWARISTALRERWREGYSAADLRADLMAGAVVGAVAVPLSMALAIASGVPPQYGLYTAVVAGSLVPLLGGSRWQVTGPTAAFVAVLAPIVGKFGMAGLLLAGLMAGVLLLALGLSRMGKLIQYIPYPVTTGFTAGIGLTIAVLQVKDFLGLRAGPLPDGALHRVAALAGALGTWSPPEAAVAAGTLAILLLWPKVNRRIPAPLAALTAAALAALALKEFGGVEVATIGSRFSGELGGRPFHGIPPVPPLFKLPWSFPGPDGRPLPLDAATLKALVPPALTVALLGAIESLLSAVVADGMGQTRHDPDAELTALGIGNILCPFFGAIPATGAIARTATGIRCGARSPLAAAFHALFVLSAAVLFAPAISRLPMASLAALLMLVAYNMAEVHRFRRILQVAPKSDAAVLLICFGLTAAFDMVVGVGVGVVLASLLFMRRMAEMAGGKILGEGRHAHARVELPPGVLLYEIAGPLFFGAAENAVGAVRSIGNGVRTVVLLMEEVPVMDVTGLAALESVLDELRGEGKAVILAGVRPQPMRLIRRAGLERGTRVCGSLEEAAAAAAEVRPSGSDR